ncbi:Pentatricopeptide repeat-containing protein [Seminavis robusta]|uniref:Pentatricopeptide repeat-containing protein n=1 Tax=Seminavis robusta TaxID=568900 RepID=A0A9N8H8Z7_9STRA|nr:Pentatricopeptide repeat-containing protein [Seminavis robusta]|eukprot:Sro174_g076790.1 Pentatricopeptide repeat-containing protein (660) ;mRNA; r:78632-80611
MFRIAVTVSFLLLGIQPSRGFSRSITNLERRRRSCPVPKECNGKGDEAVLRCKTVLCVAQQGAQERRKAESLERGHHPLMSLNLNLDSLAQGGAAPRAQELLERIQALYQEGYYAVSPDVVSYNSVLNAWVKRNEPQKALELLKSLEAQRDSPVADDKNIIEADVISYNTVIYAFAQNGLYKEAEALLREMQQHPDENIRPDSISFNSVLYAYAQSKETDAPAKAEALLREMMTDENEAQVDTASFNVVLHAWANCKKVKAPHRAQELLEHMETLSEAGNSRVKPDVYSYTTVIQAWVSQMRHRHRRRENKSRGNHFDKTQKTLTQQGANTAAAPAAYRLLKKMEEQQLQPNQITYTSVMSALCWSGQPDEAHKLLLHLLERFQQQQNMVGESTSAAAMLVKPDTIAFSAVMDGWVKNSNHHSPKALQRVMELLDLMKHWQSEGHDDMAPNSRTYTSVISALAKSRTWDACLKAKSILKEIPEGATVIHYNAVLDAYAKSPRADKARHAKTLLGEMMANPSVSPDIISFNSVLSACAGSFGDAALKKESLSIAVAVFKHICQSEDLTATAYTFSIMIKTLRKLVFEEAARYDFVGKIFQLCCKNGQVNAGVWQQVKKSIPSDETTEHLWNTLLGDVVYREGLQIADLPDEWKSKAKLNY